MSTNPKIEVTAVGGSIREGNFTWKALNLVADEYKKHSHVNLEMVNPNDLNLSPPGSPQTSSKIDAFKQRISQSTGVILSTPEYHGSYSSVIKLVIENLGFPSVLAGKPVALLGVAAGQIGAIKALEHLRSVCSHIGAIVLPGPVSVANVQSLFNKSGQCTDPRTEKRIRSIATNLSDYIHNHVCPKVTLENMVREGCTIKK